LEVEVVDSNYDEVPLAGTAPEEVARRRARGKLEAVLARRTACAILAADTVVDVDGIEFGKPRDAADAKRMLRVLSGRSHLVHTAYAFAAPGIAEPTLRTSTTAVRFHRLEEEVIAEYVASGEPMDKAGAYGIQGRASALVSSISGDYFTVMGFPLGDFIRTLRHLGFLLPSPK
jgi:septum formation protein